MKKALSTLALTLIGIALWAQQFSPEEVGAEITSEESPGSIAGQLDELSAESPLYFHALSFEVNQKLSAIEPLADGYYYRLSAPQLAMRIFLEIDKLTPGDTLFLLNESGKRREYVCADNLYQEQWSSAIYDNEITLYFKNSSGSRPEIDILNYSLELPGQNKQTDDFGDSDPCEVNVNCSEGDNYKKVKNSVARILIKHGTAYSWCTGTLMNNTAADCRLLMLTAEHCGLRGSTFVSSSDMTKWVFYFNYEAVGCSDPASEFDVNYKRVTGATLLARSDDNGGDEGSDFILMELINAFPADYEPSFAGWNRVETAPQQGVVIHHPDGDIKKISTYTKPAVSGEYTSASSDTHWLVNWSMTTNGHGVTEGGSSGCALLDVNGLMTGMLTGGAATCNSPTSNDYFGKFSYSWKSNGTAKNRQLAPWLDPTNSGVLVLPGAKCGETLPGDLDVPKPLPTLLTKDKMLYIKEGSSKNLVEVHIINSSGRLIYQSEKFAPLPDTPRPINLEKFANGVYFVRILVDDKPIVTKIVIAN